MHYLIQKTTRQHVAVSDDMPCPVECVKVRADKDGWVKHIGPVSPVPFDAYVDVICNSGVQLRGVADVCIDWSNIAKYRPLPDESECDTMTTAFDRLHEAGRALAQSACSAADIDRIIARAGETMPHDANVLDRTLRYRPDDLPADTAPGHETAAMLLSIICAFAIGVLIGWGWM